MQGLECRLLSPELVGPLDRFFQRIVAAGEQEFFHPHPLTAQHAVERGAYLGKDLYYLLVDGQEALGYGMLRGWDEGFKIPSLGIAIDPGARHLGLGRLLMAFLHGAARRRGAHRVRLRVSGNNIGAVALYRSLGYAFEGEPDGQMLGYLDL
jgi:[ribosomal protein S18]-alanine N-acetyltransferase